MKRRRPNPRDFWHDLDSPTNKQQYSTRDARTLTTPHKHVSVLASSIQFSALIAVPAVQDASAAVRGLHLGQLLLRPDVPQAST